MQESKLIAEILPAIPEYLDLLASLRDKYDIPLLSPDVGVARYAGARFRLPDYLTKAQHAVPLLT